MPDAAVDDIQSGFVSSEFFNFGMPDANCFNSRVAYYQVPDSNK